MARIPYADIRSETVAPLARKISAERGKVLHLYRMLLHSPSVAAGWLDYLTAIRQHCALPGDVRELVIIRIAHLNGAPYEAEQHVPFAIKEGLSPGQIDALSNWSKSALFDLRQRAALAYADAMTRDIHVASDVFAGVRAEFADRELVELTATIAAYNMVSRFLEALQVDAGDELDPPLDGPVVPPGDR